MTKQQQETLAELVRKYLNKNKEFTFEILIADVLFPDDKNVDNVLFIKTLIRAFVDTGMIDKIGNTFYVSK